MKRVVVNLAACYLLAILFVWGCMYFDTGKFWPVTLFVFAPRWVVALPLIAILPLTLITRPRLMAAYVLHSWIIAVPIMGCCLGWRYRGEVHEGRSLRVMTYNVGAGKIDADELVTLLKDQRIQLVMLQECSSTLSSSVFRQLGWPYHQSGNMAIGSVFELTEMRVLARQPPSHYNAVAAIECLLQFRNDSSHGDDPADVPIEKSSARIVCLHLPTFRPALERMRHLDRQAGDAIIELGVEYRAIAQKVLDQLHRNDAATIIAGDFNAPIESVYYQDYWSKYRNAFSYVGTGFGYTKHTRYHGIRIDHVLACSRWEVISACVGPNLGGDHCPVIVELSLPSSAARAIDN